MPAIGLHCRRVWPAARAVSFDHLVGAREQQLRHGEAKRLRRLNVDDQLKLRRLLDRQIGGVGPLEDLSRVNTLEAIDIRKARPITEQAAVVGEIARLGDCWNYIA